MCLCEGLNLASKQCTYFGWFKQLRFVAGKGSVRGQLLELRCFLIQYCGAEKQQETNKIFLLSVVEGEQGSTLV